MQKRLKYYRICVITSKCKEYGFEICYYVDIMRLTADSFWSSSHYYGHHIYVYGYHIHGLYGHHTGVVLLLYDAWQRGFIHVGSEQYFIEPVKGHSKLSSISGHPHLVYRRSAVQQQQHQQQQSAVTNDKVSMCGLENGGEYITALAFDHATMQKFICIQLNKNSNSALLCIRILCLFVYLFACVCYCYCLWYKER